MHPLIKTLVITIYIDHKHISLSKGKEKILHKLLCENGSFFPTYLLHFGYQLCSMSMNNFFYPAIVGAKQDWQTKVLLFPTGILFRHDLLHKTAKWLKKVTVCCAKFGSPRSRKSAPFKVYKIFAIHKICTYFMLLVDRIFMETNKKYSCVTQL